MTDSLGAGERPADQASTSTIAWMQQRLSDEYTRQGLRIAEQLRHAADAIEHEAKNIPTELETRMPDHNASAAQILKAVHTMVGNLSTANLLNAAAQADRHARERTG